MTTHPVFGAMLAEAKHAEFVRAAARDHRADAATAPRRGLRQLLAGLPGAGLLSFFL